MYLLIMLKYSVHGLCAFPNMVISVNILRKSGKIRKKRRDRWRSLSTMLVHCLHDVCAFPNMVIIWKDTGKLGKLRRKRIDIMQAVVNNVEVLFTWSVRIS